MTRKKYAVGLAGDLAKQKEVAGKLAINIVEGMELREALSQGHDHFIDLIRNKGVTTGNPLTDASIVAYGEESSRAEDTLEKVSKRFLGRVGEPALFVLHTNEGKKEHCVLLLGILRGANFVVDSKDGFCSPPFNAEVSSIDFSAMDIRVVKGGSNLFREFSHPLDITPKNLKCHVGIHQIIHFFRKYGGGTKGLIVLYLMANEIGIELPEVEELHLTLVDALNVVLDVDSPPGGFRLGHRIIFFVGGEKDYIDV